MSRRHKRYTPRDVRVPTIIAMQVTPEVGIAQHMALTALIGGWADKPQFNALGECCNLLAQGAYIKQDTKADQIAELGSAALDNIKARYIETGRFGATGDEVRALTAMVEFSEDWWNRQGGSTFHDAYQAMRREELEARAAA